MPTEGQPSRSCVILVDGGTTNTRAWLVAGDEVLARESAAVGVRDAARDGSRDRYEAGVRELLARIAGRATDLGAPEPSCVVAAGMITSGLGLAEVPHVAAPAGLAELAAGARWIRCPDVTELDVLLVPGIRTGALEAAPDTVGGLDVMRGEETLCLGLLDLGLLEPGGVLLNLGSHWKVIWTDTAGRVEASTTSLTGELIHLARTQTVLATAVPTDRPYRIDSDWFGAGLREAERAGLGRALFCVRLLELRAGGTPDQRLCFMLGAFTATDVQPLLDRRLLRSDTPVAICGGHGLGDALGEVLRAAEVPVDVLDDNDVERGMVMGLRRIATRAGADLHEDTTRSEDASRILRRVP